GWEAQSPQPGDGERVAIGVADLATELAACGIISIDLAAAEVADQDVAAKSAESRWGQRHCPRRVELAPAREPLQSHAIRGELVDEPIAWPGGIVMLERVLLRERHEQIAADVSSPLFGV